MTRLSDTANKVLRKGSSGELFIIAELTGNAVMRERLLELGLAPGRSLQIFRKLPFGGPIVVRAGSLSLALRSDEADEIWLTT